MTKLNDTLLQNLWNSEMTKKFKDKCNFQTQSHSNVYSPNLQKKSFFCLKSRADLLQSFHLLLQFCF